MSADDQDQSSAASDAMSAAISAGTSGSATLAEGGNVKQSFMNSTVNIVAGDQILDNEGDRDIHSREGDTSVVHEGTSQPKNSLKNIRDDYNENLKRSSTSLETDQGSAKYAKWTERKIVTQTFESSSLNTVAGNLIIQNYHHATVAEPSPRNKEIINEKLIQICNNNTLEATAIDILEDFRHEKLQKPDFEVYPQMRKVDVDDYYKGRNDDNQLTQEVGFLRQKRMQSENIGIGDVVTLIWRRRKLDSSTTVGITAIVASAGSGKSTLTRRIARHALGASPEIIDHAEEQSPYGKRMVHYIELKDVEEKGDIKASKFLFGGLYETESEEDQAFKWLDEHQSEAVLIFDGLDQARWDFETKNPRKIKKHDKASCWTVMYNILARNILRHVNVYIASREFKVSELPALARPETIITLNGLTFEDSRRLFAFLLKENGEELWQKIDTMSPRLINLVTVPVFLILTAVVMGRDPSKPPPTTVTELYNRIISALQSVENIRNREQILSIVNKLKALAFFGMREGRVVFKETDLKEFGVSAEEVQDLMTKVPGNNLLSRHLMQGNFRFFFCHQSLQEYLAAIFIAQMEINEFSRFDEEHLHEKRWSVVRRFVAGVIFSKSQSELYEVANGTEKEKVLTRSIRLLLETSPNRMELYTAIYESDDDNLMEDLDDINASRISLSRDEAHIVGSLAARSQSLSSLNLGVCGMDDGLLGIITRCLENQIHVNEVNLRRNKLSATALRSFLGHRQIESLSGNLDWKAVKLTVGRWILDLKNDEDVIELSGAVKGHFNIKKSTLSFDRVDHVADVVFSGILFDAEFIKCDKQQQLLAKPEDLRNMSDCKLEKISKILLDCTEEDNIDWSVMETYWEKYQMEHMEIAVNGQIPVDDDNEVLGRSEAISVCYNIHAMFYVAKEDEVTKIVADCKQNKIEYIRCLLGYKFRASLDDISSLVSNSNLKKLTLIYYKECDIWKGDELAKAQKIANDVDTELELLALDREKDAWQRLDKEFFMREQEKRES